MSPSTKGGQPQPQERELTQHESIMIDRLQWLHISDLHFRADVVEGDQFSQLVACQALLTHFGELSSRPVPQFVIVTGDIAFSGEPRQYEEARKFFDKLSRELSVPPEMFFFVPGNHDVDRTINALALGGACAACTSQQDVDRILGSSDFHTVLERQREFWSFVEAFTNCQQRKFTHNKMAYVSQLTVDALKINLFGINSAWLCGRDCEVGKLLIGERQIIDLIELSEASDANLSLGLAHHPIEWLYQWDQVTCRTRLLPRVDFYHRGHLHQPEVYLSSLPSSPCLSVAAGAGHASRFYRNSYNLVSLDLGSGDCTVSTFEYSANQIRYNHCGNTTAKMSLNGKMPCDMATLYGVICDAVPSAHAYAGYMCGLLFGYFEEIPVHVAGMKAMVVPDSVSDSIPDEALAFLGLRNRLRLYDDAIPLLDHINQHQPEIRGFSDYLKETSAGNNQLASQIGQKNVTGIHLMGSKPVRQRSFAVELLRDLEEAQDWSTLEVQARRYDCADESIVAAQARQMLIEALIHSDETQKRDEGVVLAKEMLEQQTSGANQYLLAAGAAERVRDDAWALNLAMTMIKRWPDNESVRVYVRSLALRLGNKKLREATERLPNNRGRR